MKYESIPSVLNPGFYHLCHAEQRALCKDESSQYAAD